MNFLSAHHWMLASPLMMLIGLPAAGTAAANLQAEILLDNPRVLVQKFIVQPGQSTVQRSSGDQLLVFVKGGVLTTRAGRSTVWRDGRVMWRQA